MNLPKELQEVILGYIDPKDKVYAAMACTQFKHILENMFNQKYKNANHIPTNCAYDLSLYLSIFTIPDNKYFKFKQSDFYYGDWLIKQSQQIDSTDNNFLNVLVHFNDR